MKATCTLTAASNGSWIWNDYEVREQQIPALELLFLLAEGNELSELGPCSWTYTDPFYTAKF